MVQEKIKKEAWPLIIRAFRDDFGLTQGQMQALLGLSPQSPIVSQWEAGYRTPKQHLYYALADRAAVLIKQMGKKRHKQTWCKL